MSNPTAIQIQYSSSVNFTASFPPAQRIIVGNNSNPLYQRYAMLTQDSVQMVYYTASVVIPLTSLYQAAFIALPSLTYPPAITSQPTSSAFTAPGTASFAVAVQSELPFTYKWLVQPSGSSNWNLPTGSTGILYQGTASAALTASYTTNTIPYYNFECTMLNTSGPTTSSIVTLTIS